ncbi:MAG: Fpg/Nei family DNA glycosylase [Polyangiales bacterium]
MPEGDTILRTATTLAPVLVGKEVTRFAATRADLAHAHLVGHRVTGVDAHGKHLFIRFDDGRVLHSHMRMTGSWHLYRPGDRWRRPAHRARCVLEVAGAVAVCFDAPVLRLMMPSAVRRDPTLAALGPDVLAADFDEVEAVRRLRTLGAEAIGAAILDQRALAGVGNIYKSETLFRCRVDPRTTVAALDAADPSDESGALVRIVREARRLMRANLTTVSRTTSERAGARYDVYRRSGRACRRCGETIKMVRQGRDARSTYWCPGCQPKGG